MRRSLSLVALLVGVGLLVAALIGRGEGVSLPHVDSVAARGLLDAGGKRFGELVHGRIDILVPRDSVDPATLRWSPDFSPYRLSGPVRQRRWDDGPVSLVRYEFRLECLEAACLPRAARAGLVLPPARIDYVSAAGTRAGVEVGWPAITTGSWHSSRAAAVFPWHTGLGSLAAPETRVPARLLAVLLALAALGCAACAAALLVPRLLRVLPRRATPGDRRSMLERALAAVRSAAGAEDVAERRRALDLLARELRIGGGGPEARAARRLAWSRRAPRGRDMEQLAESVERSGRWTGSV